MDVFDLYRARTAATLIRRAAEGALPPDLDLGRFDAAPPASGAACDIVIDAALVYASAAAAAGQDSLALAEAIARDLANDPRSASVEVAGRGFVNVTLRPAAILDAVTSVLRGGAGLAGAAGRSIRLRPDVSFAEARSIVAAEQRSALFTAAGHLSPRGGSIAVRRDVASVVVHTRCGTAARARTGDWASFASVDADGFRFSVAAQRSDAVLHVHPSAISDRSRDNPAFWVPYAHARFRRVLRRAAATMPDLDLAPSALAGSDLSALTDIGEGSLARLVARHPHIVATAAAAAAPHRLAAYLCELATSVHSVWNRSKDQPQLRFVNEEERDLTKARLGLVTASTLVLKSGLDILGVDAPDEMA